MLQQSFHNNYAASINLTELQSFEQQMFNLTLAGARNHEEQLECSNKPLLSCHFYFMSVSGPSKAWISNSDMAATNQTVIVSLPQGKHVKLGFQASVGQSGLHFSESI